MSSPKSWIRCLMKIKVVQEGAELGMSSVPKEGERIRKWS